MLRSSNKSIRLSLGVHFAAIAFVEGREVVEWHFNTVISSQEAPWRHAMDWARNWLLGHQLNDRSLHVRLAVDLAPLALLSWHDEVVRVAQQKVLAQAHFQRIYGAHAETWQVQVESTGYQRPWMAAAIDPNLIDALHEGLPDCRVMSIQPITIATLNALMGKLSQPSWLLLPEIDYLTALYMQDGQLKLLKTLPIHLTQQSDIRAVLESELQLSGLLKESFEICSPVKMPGVTTLLDLGWHASKAQKQPLHLLGGVS